MTDFYQEENIYLLETVLKVCMNSYANVCQSSLSEYFLEELIFKIFFFVALLERMKLQSGSQFAYRSSTSKFMADP